MRRFLPKILQNINNLNSTCSFDTTGWHRSNFIKHSKSSLIEISENIRFDFRLDFRLSIRVANTSESEPALFSAKKDQKPPPIFPIKKMTPPVIFIVFLCGNFSHNNSKLQKIF